VFPETLMKTPPQSGGAEKPLKNAAAAGMLSLIP